MTKYKAIIGYSGFVGSTLMKQTTFNYLYRSSNIQDIDTRYFDIIISSAAPAQKWVANREPQADRQNIEGLISHLKTVTCKLFILISTVDVFKNSFGVNEDTQIDEGGLHPYGMNRRLLEKFVEDYFPNYLIVRLPGLVGSGLRKNVIFDFLNNNNIHVIDSRDVFQFYPMVNLWYDIQTSIQAGLKLVHLTAEPMSVADVSMSCFGKRFNQILSRHPAVYDFQSIHAVLFGGKGRYQYSRRESIQAIRAYVQTEPIRIMK